jgi:hypothetical protein
MGSSRIAPFLKSAAAWSERLEVEQDDALSSLIDRVDLGQEGLRLSIKLPLSNAENGAPVGSSHLSIKRHVPMQLRRRGVELRLVVNGGARASCKTDQSLLRAVSRTHCWFDDLVTGRCASMVEIAKRNGVGKQYVSRLIRLAFLALEMVELIVAARQPPELTAQALRTGRPDIPVDWAALDRPHPQCLLFGCIRPFELQRPRQIALQHRWVDVTFAAHGGRVTELFRYLLDHLQGTRLGGFYFVQFIQREDRKIGPGPRAKLLGSYFAAGNRPQIFVHIPGVDAAPGAVVVNILKQLRTRQIAASLYDTRELAVTDYAAMADTALAAKIELNLPAFNANVMILKRREAKAFVLPSILEITDARQSALHQSHDGSQNFFARQASSRQVNIDLPADCRQRAPKDKHVLEF